MYYTVTGSASYGTRPRRHLEDIQEGA